MRKLFDELCEIIKRNIPHAMISWDASLWISQADMTQWWLYFKDSKVIDFIHTNSVHMRNSLSLQFMNELTQKMIIVESGNYKKTMKVKYCYSLLKLLQC